MTNTLPEMVATVHISAGFVSMAVAPIVDGKYDLYTAEQTREYAEQAVEAEAKRIFDEGMTTVGHMREQIKKAVEAEREACALLAATPVGTIAAAIRARSKS